MALKQKIQFLYGSTVYTTSSLAIAALDTVQMYPGQPVAAFWGNSTNPSAILVIGTGEGKGSNYYKVLATEASLAELEETVTNLGSSLSTVSGKVGVLEGKMSTAEGNINTLQGDVEDLQGDVEDIQGDIEDINSEITNLKGEDKKNADALAAHEKVIGGAALGHVKNGDSADVTIQSDGTMSVPALANKANIASPEFTGTPTIKESNIAADDNSAKIPTTAWVKAAIDGKIAAANALTFKGTIGTGGDITALPSSATLGDVYVAIAGAPAVNGVALEAGDMVICSKGGESPEWSAVQKNLDGIVTGPSSVLATDNIAIFDGTTGKLIKDGGKKVSDFALGETTVTGTDGLKGGGAISGNVTISHDVAGEGTAVSGSGANKYINGLKIDKNGHVTEATFGEVVIPEDDHKVLVDDGDTAAYMGTKFNTATPTADNTIAVAFEVKNHKVEATVVISEICGGTF